MGTMKDQMVLDSVNHGWCQADKDLLDGYPDDPALFYDVADFMAWGWFQALNTNDSAKAQALLKQSADELATDMAAGEFKDRLAAIGQGTADLAVELTWWLANHDRALSESSFMGKLINYLQGPDLVAVATGSRAATYHSKKAIKHLIRKRSELDAVTYTVAHDALLALWKTRCTKVEFANGMT